MGLEALVTARSPVATKSTLVFIKESATVISAPDLALIAPLPECSNTWLTELPAVTFTSPPPSSEKLAISGAVFTSPPMRPLVDEATCILLILPPATTLTSPPPSVATPLVNLSYRLHHLACGLIVSVESAA